MSSEVSYNPDQLFTEAYRMALQEAAAEGHKPREALQLVTRVSLKDGVLHLMRADGDTNYRFLDPEVVSAVNVGLGTMQTRWDLIRMIVKMAIATPPFSELSCGHPNTFLLRSAYLTPYFWGQTFQSEGSKYKIIGVGAVVKENPKDSRLHVQMQALEGEKPSAEDHPVKVIAERVYDAVLKACSHISGRFDLWNGVRMKPVENVETAVTFRKTLAEKAETDPLVSYLLDTCFLNGLEKGQQESKQNEGKENSASASSSSSAASQTTTTSSSSTSSSATGDNKAP